MTKLIFERTKPCSELLEPDMKTESIQECSDKTSECHEEIQTDPFEAKLNQRKFSCPTLLFFRDEGQTQFVRERSVDSDAGDFTSAESVVETLDKLNGINTVTIKRRKIN